MFHMSNYSYFHSGALFNVEILVRLNEMNENCRRVSPLAR